MNAQPEAMQIIQHMDDEYPEDWDGKRIRAELRRLNALNAELLEALNRQYALNAELLEALKLADAMLSGANMNASVVEKKVRAAIAKTMAEIK